MLRYLLLATSLMFGCFQEIDFPGEQAEIDTDQVNGQDTVGVNEAIFDEFLLDGFDSNGDLIDDIAISALLVIASDIDAEVICEAAANSLTFAQFINKFADGRFAGVLTLITEDLQFANGARGFANNDNILGNAADVIVSSFFLSNNNNARVVEAFNDDLLDVIFIDDINPKTLNADFAGLLQFDFATNAQGDSINADMQAKLFNAAQCDFDNVIKDFIGL
jgi:hypothetical protein